MPDTGSAKPRILIVHNRYRLPGGEDTVANAQALLLASRGHQIRTFEKSNLDINSFSFLRKARLFFDTANNPESAREIAEVISEFKPDVAHVHNTLPLISPSVYAPLKKAGVKIIQWLHNFRLVCPAGTMYRDGAPCSLCLDDKSFAPAIKYRCWSESKMATMAIVRMLKQRRKSGAWGKEIDLFVALNSAQKNILVEHARLPEEKVIVLPNFHDASSQRTCRAPGENGEFIFVGRLTPEKGVYTLLKAMRALPAMHFAIAGDGPLRDLVQRACARPGHVYLGPLPREQLLERLSAAHALIFASEWAEGCPSVILEALSCGVPVIASSVAGAVELLTEGRTALFFPPGNSDALAACIRLFDSQSELQGQMNRNALESYASNFTPAAGYQNLLAIYSRLGINVDHSESTIETLSPIDDHA